MVTKETYNLSLFPLKRRPFFGERNLYCYANTDQEKASRTPAAIGPDAPSLSRIMLAT